MMDIVLRILAFIVAISVLVAVHEFGHFWVARKLGFKVLRFSIGFGRPLAKWTGRDPDRVEYWLSAIPLGGYVKMLDEREGPVPEAEQARGFTRRPIPHRVAVLLAGPGFNFLFAIVAYWAVFVAGVPGIKPVIGAVEPNSIAARAGLVPDDRIEAVNGKATQTWDQATVDILDRLLKDGRVSMSVRGADGTLKQVDLNVSGKAAELNKPDAPFSSLGIQPAPVMPPLVARIDPGSPAASAGFAAGDRVRSAAGTPIQSWSQWVDFVRARPGETVPVEVLRDGKSVHLTVTIGAVEQDGKRVGQVGIYRPEKFPEGSLDRLRAEQRYGVFAAVPRGAHRAWEMTALTVRILGHMITGQVSLRSVAGPIAIATYAADSAKAGFSAFLSFLGIVSINLGIMNLLPVPLLDGGQVVYQLIEAVKGGPLSEKALIVGQQLSVLFLIVLMSFVFYNDIARIFGG
jgi:regulator of sigma E protease